MLRNVCFTSEWTSDITLSVSQVGEMSPDIMIDMQTPIRSNNIFHDKIQKSFLTI